MKGKKVKRHRKINEHQGEPQLIHNKARWSNAPLRN